VDHPANSRPLDALAIATIIGLCLCWGFNQVAIKIAIHDIPPFFQSAARSAVAAILVAAWARWRGLPLFERDGTLVAGVAAGILFALEFVLIYPGLLWTTATRAVLFIYLAPFFVVIGSRWFIPGDHFHPSQWFGLALSFVGILIAFGLPTPATNPHQMLGDIMMVGAALAWAATTLVIKASALKDVSAEKTMLYQLVVSAPPSAVALGALAYQTIWVVSVTYVIWFALVVRYSATRLSAFTFLTPLFGVAAGRLVLGEPMTPPFALAVALVAGGLVLVNRPR
jgi:drug/metabolite transporter (DMT)-like permease